MPFTMGAFFIGALSVTGLPPFGGTWSKVYLALGGLEAGDWFVVAVLMLSSLLNVAYLLPIVGRAFFARGNADGEGASQPPEIAEAPRFCVVPLCITASLCFVLFFFASDIAAALAEAFAVPP